MKKLASGGVSFIILGAACADSANLYPTIILLSMGAALLIGQKLCGIIVL